MGAHRRISRLLFPAIILILGWKAQAQNYPVLSHSSEPNYYRDLFKCLKEPAFSGKNKEKVSIRLTLNRSLDPLMIVRVEAIRDRAISMVREVNGQRPPKYSGNKLIVLNGFNAEFQPRFAPAAIQKSTRKECPGPAWREFLTYLEAQPLDSLPRDQVRPGARDGSVWILEIRKAGQYRFFSFRPDENAQLKGICLKFLEVAQARIENLY